MPPTLPGEPLTYIAAQVTVDRRRPALPLHHRLPLAAPGALNALLFDRLFSPLSGHHAGFL